MHHFIGQNRVAAKALPTFDGWIAAMRKIKNGTMAFDIGERVRANVRMPLCPLLGPSQTIKGSPPMMSKSRFVSELLLMTDDFARKFTIEKIGCLIGKAVRSDRDEHRVRVVLGEFDRAERDADHMRPKMIVAGLRRRPQIVPTNFDLCHV